MGFGKRDKREAGLEREIRNHLDEMHHRAQLMLIERMIGIVPHRTRQREARTAARQS